MVCTRSIEFVRITNTGSKRVFIRSVVNENLNFQATLHGVRKKKKKKKRVKPDHRRGKLPTFLIVSHVQSQHIEKDQTASLSIVFQPRVVGLFRERIAITTNLGTVYFEVSGNAISNVYELRPFVGLRVPSGIPYTLPIHFLNPHKDSILIEDVSTSGSFLEISNTNVFASSPKKVGSSIRSKSNPFDQQN